MWPAMPKPKARRSRYIWDGVPILVQSNVALGLHAIHLRCGRRCAGSDHATVLRLLWRRHRYAGRPGLGYCRRRDPRSETSERKHRLLGRRDHAIPIQRASHRRPAGILEHSPLMLSSEAGGSGSVGWHYSVDNADIQFLAQGQTLVQTYTVLVTDDHGATTPQDVTIAINGANDAPTAVNENIITDVGPDGIVGIPAWALGANDTDPDTIDHVVRQQHCLQLGWRRLYFRRRFLHRRLDAGRFVHLQHLGRHRDQRQHSDRSGRSTTRPRRPRLSGPAATISSSPRSAGRRSMAAAATTSWWAIPAAMS